MHPNSLKIMKNLLSVHVPATDREIYDVYDVGSYDVNGTYRPIVEGLGFCDYKGIDIEAGPNVDIIVPADGTEWILPPREIVISGQCLEHTRFPWKWFEQVVELATAGGLLFIIAPWTWPEHRYPVDCWRILPDGMLALGDWCHLEVIEVGRSNAEGTGGHRGMLGDCWGVFRK